jgi:mannose-6-phosphate isomerase-like protein (cupin superfamily)
MALKTGETFENPNSGGTITIRESWVDNDNARVVIERVFPPDTGHAEPHVHLDFDQTFEVISGAGRLDVDGKEREVGAGERVDLPTGTPHRDLFNAGTDEMVARLTIEPVPRFVEMYAETWMDLYTKGEANDQDEMPLLQILVLVQASDGKSFAAGPPRWLQKATLPLIAAIGRMRGYRALG